MKVSMKNILMTFAGLLVAVCFCLPACTNQYRGGVNESRLGGDVHTAPAQTPPVNAASDGLAEGEAIALDSVQQIPSQIVGGELRLALRSRADAAAIAPGSPMPVPSPQLPAPGRPSGPDPAAASEGARSLDRYTVQAGDSLWAIADKKLGSGSRWQELAKLNQVDEDSLRPGQVLVIPDAAPVDREDYDVIVHNPFKLVADEPLSTFSVDVDTASYSNVRRFLMANNQLPPADAVRIEELVNYFRYDYPAPDQDDARPFATHVEVAGAPWAPEHRLVKIGLKGREISSGPRKNANFVFLLDVSGSMNSPDKLPLLVRSFKLLTDELADTDRVAIVVYAGASGLVLDSTPGARRQEILDALDKLKAGGSTAGAAGIELAYSVASENFIEGGINRVILATDGDFNVGISDTGSLVRMIEEKAQSGIYLTALGFGTGNLNDEMMEKLTNAGDGNYFYIDSIREAQKVFLEEMGGTLVAIAKDVKIQVEFNPERVSAYRLIGYENRLLAKEDFNDDTKDAGDIGEGHSVTALYEIVPVGVELPNDLQPGAVDPLKYQKTVSETVGSPEILTVKVRYKEPDAPKEQGTSKLLEFPTEDSGASFAAASPDFRFATAVAAFGMVLRDSPYAGGIGLDQVLEMAKSAIEGSKPSEYRTEFLKMLEKAAALKGGSEN